jgi:hypothetical protein
MVFDIEAVGAAGLLEAKSLTEVALTALAKIKVMNLKPEHRRGLQAACGMLERVVGDLRENEGTPPRQDRSKPSNVHG